MFIDQDDTICAISTPPGIGGIAVARVSGPDAFGIVSRIWRGCDIETAATHTAHLGEIIDPADNGSSLDQALITLFRAPRSFTGENVVEISVHGSTWIQSELLRLLIDAGARMAQPGEFSRRAFASGKMDLAETEAVADLIASNSRASHRLAINQMRGNFSRKLRELRETLLSLCALLELELDFSEEDVEFASRHQLLDLANDIDSSVSRLVDSFATGSAIKEGIPVAIIGNTNAGKSTLLNLILGDNRAIVSDIHGTTRDTIEDTVTIKGAVFRIIDTAGLRKTSDPIESLGIDRTLSKARSARIIVWVIDPATPAEKLAETAATVTQTATADGESTPVIAAINKSDLRLDTTAAEAAAKSIGAEICHISAADGSGLPTLLNLIHDRSGAARATENEVLVTNARHYQALVDARQSIRHVIQGLNQSLSGDLIAQDLREIIHHLGTITGSITTPEILQTVFTRFCIGK